ncbi:MAG: acetyl-CoA carboxylase biotin carboxylase subunit [Planctomycetes bacterium]|nr:acetyl-CoA carboxylase biotin carboxylase subunit [Planctomycetota bacterium]MCL4728867.1 acetyl-CoA carboxylase biotin carboxylase subunit [Planctomycetota bacterium]
MLKKVLIANRGEIALRVIRACKKLGVASVAVYSDADAHLPFVRNADESHYLGPSVAAESYLNIGRIIELAKRHGCDGIHPGYGFLSENAAFARACEEAGITFIGPDSGAIDRLGDKRHAKDVAEKAGVPVTPWIQCAGTADTATVAAISRIGFPVIIKPAAGGGGKGMHKVTAADQLAELLPKAAREAKAGFGDDALLVEKFLDGPKHIEVQILADRHGTVLHLFERECSLQRRHQKLLEETPSPSLTPDQRAAICADAVRIARTAGYSNAGTCEFLFDAQAGKWYFCEVNTRLQVEHPVTEQVTGVDLVEWQLRIAAGEKLTLKQQELKQTGHAIELRINSEDPFAGFMPSLGYIEAFEPPTGEGIRVDAGYAAGDSVTQFYDSLIAKLIVHAPDRAAAADRAVAALREFMVVGVATTIPFHIALLRHPDVRAGRFNIRWVEEHLAELARRDDAQAAAVLAALMEYRHLQKVRTAQSRAGELHFDPWSSSSLPRLR